ncbi:MAG: protein rep, partial [Planctomycetes bacterium]|nr:protein rep [Planctomycetota bacterium]
PNLCWTEDYAPPVSSQLDPVETPVRYDPCSPTVGAIDPQSGLVDTFRHTGWAARRAAIHAALWDAGCRLSRRLRFQRCGADRWILRNRQDPTIFKVVTAKCHDRFCSPCVVDRQAVIRRNLQTRLAEGTFRFLTLTLRHHHEPLKPLFNRLHTAFRKLRQTSHWKDRVSGGVAIYELTYDPAANGWHPHLHCILQGRYMDVVLLRRTWLAITGDSTGVDISLIRSKHGAIDYVCKYSTKAMPPGIFRDPNALAEAIETLSKRRLVLCFGAWRNFRLLVDPDERSWEAFDSIESLRLRRSAGSEIASRVLAMLPTADAHTAEFIVDLDHLPPPEY